MTTIEDLLDEIKAIPAGTVEYELWKPDRVYADGVAIENESMVAALVVMKMISKGLYPYARVDGRGGATLRFSSDTHKKPGADERRVRAERPTSQP